VRRRDVDGSDEYDDVQNSEECVVNGVLCHIIYLLVVSLFIVSKSNYRTIIF